MGLGLGLARLEGLLALELLLEAPVDARGVQRARLRLELPLLPLEVLLPRDPLWRAVQPRVQVLHLLLAEPRLRVSCGGQGWG